MDRKFEEVTVQVQERLAKRVRWYAKQYRTSFGGMVCLALTYYFGDGRDHLRCEYCAFGQDGYCSQEASRAGNEPDEAEKTTVPLLDKGTVVVGHPTLELGL